MALSGMAEAFVYGVADNGKQAGNPAVAHGFVGIVFYIMAPLLVLNKSFGSGGTVGLVAVNGLCMALRSIYSLHFAHLHFSKYCNIQYKSRLEFVGKFSPKFPMIMSFIVSFFMSGHSRVVFIENQDSPLMSMGTLCHIDIGITSF
mmetsp:Transcript_6368/g.9258  ORF Transcript_6368/g.9258 Transcript_6368/m.9258 type:complete len:146 (+) Transcript_6368:2823-3260(+)